MCSGSSDSDEKEHAQDEESGEDDPKGRQRGIENPRDNDVAGGLESARHVTVQMEVGHRRELRDGF